ncbi:MAG TPA: hypothetical protein VFI31_02125 [Pirellulales bacterium]|nr:hypothetical protein [Pirellulales bacterium]
MNIQEHNQLRSEQTALRRMLAGIPPENVLDRSGLEARLEEVDERLASGGAPGRGPARAVLTFGGRPVLDRRGIFADFGSQAANRFTDAVAKVVAGLAAPLAAMGPVPNRAESQLLITSTAVGSFGFEFEEYRPSVLDFGEESPTGQALQIVQGLLEGTRGTDDDLADSAAAADPRAVAAVREFLELLAASEAVCALEFNERSSRFRDVGEVRRAVARLSRENLREERKTLRGEFLGVLPEARRFEFKLSTEGEVIRGKIGPAVGDPDAINRHLHQPTEIAVMATQVGSGKPRYVLQSVPAWEGK